MVAALDEVVNSLYQMVQDAWAVPLGGDKCVIERDRALDLLDELRVNMPADVKMAKDIVEKRNELIAAGKREAEAIRKQAEEAARQQVSETEIVQQARRKAKEILGNAEIQARELRRVANEYCEDTLKRAEEAVALSLDEVKKARSRFKAASK
ncbi:hypothetical protein [Intestinibacillus massiliensis]|uniref:hypothetical protein n=1 Tax=Intestinibacillus massiliensis TaxID=1871029 RepID=UPI000B35FE81|nr:hypothetical protein [Intestinibacillus massiliensis]